MSARQLRKILAAASAIALAVAPAAQACTGIKLTNADGTIVHGRTVEFGIPLEIDMVVVPRGYDFVGSTPLGDGKKWTSKYGASGAILFGNLAIMDGLNEKGLAVGTFYFPTEAEYTPTTAAQPGESMSAVDFANWLLTQFATVSMRCAQRSKAARRSSRRRCCPAGRRRCSRSTGSSTTRAARALVIEPLGGKLVLTTTRSASSPTRPPSTGT